MSGKGEILVTGGAGYIGSHTIVELVSAGYSPVIVDNFSNTSEKVYAGLKKIIGENIPLYKIDVRDEEGLRDVFSKHHFQGVIHFAAFKAVGDSVKDPLSYYSNNVEGLVSVVKIMNEFKVKNLVFSSSCTVYGEPKNEIFVDEETEQNEAFSPYGATKQIGERILFDVLQSGAELNVLALRYFNPIGAHSSGLIGELPLGSPNNLLPFLVQTAVGKRECLTVFGNDYETFDGTCIRDYIHVCDVANAHVSGLNWIEKKMSPTIDVVNIGTGSGKSVLEIISTFEKVSGQKLKWQYGPKREGDIMQIVAKVDKAKKELNWEAKRSIEDAIRDAWQWEQNLLNEN